jgi:hypothetical protein
MSSMALSPLLVVLAACGGSTVTDYDCEQAKNATCDHQVACDLEPDFASCYDDLELDFICDFTKTKDEFKACQRSQPSCIENISEECLNVLCSSVLGCGFETVTGGSGAELGGEGG